MKQRTIITRLILVIMCYASVAVGQGRNALADSLISKLKVYASNHISEKAYLQFDKPYYTSGDTVYFKAYVTVGNLHQLSDTSGILHVDLINAGNKIDQSIKLQLQNGIAWGDFALPDSLPKGNYRVRAYTNWMRNDGEAAFFDKIIPVASALNNKIAESGTPHKALRSKPDIQFMPEGGTLVAGIHSKIAFKAIGANGLGIDAKGVVTDDENNEVCSFASGHLGMGYFYLRPAGGKNYKARVTFANGQENTFDLPKADAKGIVLTVNNDSIPQASVKIEANEAYLEENGGKNYIVVIYSGDAATTVTRKLGNGPVNLHILKRHLHTGVTGITLFAPTGEPLCERLIFVQNYDQLNIAVGTDKDTYTKREKVNLKLNVQNRKGEADEGHFSVSVVDESKVPDDEATQDNILTYLLLTSALKGYVEQPAYYFNDTSAVARQNLDVLMLTQGYRKFEWKQVLGNNSGPLAYAPEKGLEINGQVKNLVGKPVANGTINLVTMKGGQVFSTVTDNSGMFHFPNLIFSDTTHFMLNATRANGKNTTKIIYFTDKPEPVTPVMQPVQPVQDTTMAALVANAKKQRIDEINYGGFKGKMLKEVNIKDKKLNDYRTQSLAGAGNADQVMHADEIERIQGMLSISLSGRLHGVIFVNGVPSLTRSGLNHVPMLVIVDGTILNSGPEPPNVDFIPVNQVETVEVLKYYSTAIYGVDGGNGVLVITTKQGGVDPRDVASIGVLPVMPKGFYKAREFYQPKYDNPALAQKQHDYRSTICWKPEVATWKDGSASFEYYNADATGTYRVVVEGIDNNGNIGRQVFRYKVQ